MPVESGWVTGNRANHVNLVPVSLLIMYACPVYVVCMDALMYALEM